MEQFKIRQNAFKEIKKETLIKGMPFSILTAISGFVIAYFVGYGDIINTLPFIIPVLMGISIFGLNRGIKRQKEILKSYTLTLDNNGISREQKNTPTIFISNTSLNKIIKNANGSFLIKGSTSVDVIAIPSQIDEYEKLERLLSEIKQITTQKSEPLIQKFRKLISLLTIGLMVTVYVSKDKIIVGIFGTILLLMMAYSLFEIQRSKNIDSKSKGGMWWILLIIASIIGVMYYKLTGNIQIN